MIVKVVLFDRLLVEFATHVTVGLEQFAIHQHVVAAFFLFFNWLAGARMLDLIDLIDELTPTMFFTLLTRWPQLFLLARLLGLFEHIICLNFIHGGGSVSFRSISRPVKKASLVGLYSWCHLCFEIGLKTLVRRLVRTAIDLKTEVSQLCGRCALTSWRT